MESLMVCAGPRIFFSKHRAFSLSLTPVSIRLWYHENDYGKNLQKKKIIPLEGFVKVFPVFTANW